MASVKNIPVLIFILLLNLMMAFNIDVAAQSIVKKLPGYNRTLPFKLETGYIGVGDDEKVQLFYYFVESERNPDLDPLLLWLAGGPGCAGLSSFFYEIGPLAFDLAAFDGSFPSLVLNPYSWTKVASVIFIDSPVGTGFSYATDSEHYASSDTKSAKQIYEFLQEWFSSHPSFTKNRLYVAGDSYGGKIVPLVALEIVNGNEDEDSSRMNLLGYITGNGRTENKSDNNERIPYAHRMALISDEIFEIVNSSCNGDYETPDPKNFQCLLALRLVQECTKLINPRQILEPICKFSKPKPEDGHYEDRWNQALTGEDPADLLLLSEQEELWCRNNDYVTSYIWANDEAVREALHIKKGTVTDWKRCNNSLSYEKDVASVFEHHQVLNSKGYRILAFSGDHDMLVPYMSTLKWIRNLNLTLDDEWRPWTVEGQIAGYTLKYKKKEASITFATVKGAGHTAPEYKPKQCLEMLTRWLASYPL